MISFILLAHEFLISDLQSLSRLCAYGNVLYDTYRRKLREHHLDKILLCKYIEDENQ